jgi:TonB-dependent receptor
MLRAACSIAALAMFAGAAYADDDGQVETITVTGEKYSLAQSIQEKANANIVSDGISADEIGSIPEFGLGDALRKVPGVSLQINNGRGEDQFATIRGFNPDYDTTSIDGMALASTEETTRWVSLDVIPSVIISGADVDKTWRADQPTDAIGGIINLHTRSAFDHPGEHFDAHVDGSYWFDHEQVHDQEPSGNADATYSNTFGPQDEFGFVAVASYWQRSSSTTNTYTLPWSYYPTSGIGSGTPTAPVGNTGSLSGSTLAPTTNLANTIAIPDLHRWYYYDNDRYRPGVFGRFDFDDHGMFHAHIDGGWFQFINNERRYDQSLGRDSNPTIQTDTTGTFSAGTGLIDYDKYVQNREIEYIEAGGGMNFADDMHLDATFNYSIGHYAQTTAQDTFGTIPSATSQLGFSYNLAAPTAPIFTPNSLAVFMNPANYSQSYTETQLDTSTNELPQAKVEFSQHFEPDDTGLGYKVGWTWREMTQHYDFFQTEYKPKTTTLLSQIPNGTINQNVNLYDGQGQTLLLLNRAAIDQYVAANLSNYTLQTAADLQADNLNDYRLTERINAEYAEAQYKYENLYALLGLRYESTDESIVNVLPSPLNQPSPPTTFGQVSTSSNYAKFLPSLNLAYDVTDEFKIRAAATETYGRPEYAQLAQNSAASAVGNQASETISNPNLKPRTSDNFDVSAEWYWAPGAIASVAVFNKQVQNEIETVTSTINNAQNIPNCTAPCTLTLTTSQNVGSAVIQGVELNAADVKFDFLPGFLSDFGGAANASFVTFDSPNLPMSGGVLRKLPQLLYSSKTVENLSLLYSHGPYSGEITYNFTSKMPISFNTSNAVNDQWWRSISTVDAQVKYQVTDYLSLRVQGKNLFDSQPQKVVGPGQLLNYSTLENGRAIYVGVGVTF